MNYSIIDPALTPTELEAVHNDVFSNRFPWYYHPDDVTKGTGNPFMSHTLMSYNADGLAVEGTVNSDAYGFFRNIFNRLVPDHSVLFRANLNMTFHSSVAHGSIHKDHEFEHKNLLIYLSHAQGGTCLFDDDHTLIDTIKPKYNQACTFQGAHAQQMCLPGQTRVVAVFTYL